MNLQKNSAVHFLIIAIILSAIKFYKIDAASIWLDEAHSIFQTHKSFSDIINNSAKDQNPPLYFILLSSCFIALLKNRSQMRASSAADVKSAI